MTFPLLKTLLERVSVSSVGNEAHKTLTEKIKKIVTSKCKSEFKNMPFYPTVQDQNHRFNYDDGYALVTDWLQNYIQQELSTIASVKVVDANRSLIRVRFDKLNDADGQWNVILNTIFIDIKSLNALVKHIFDDMANTFYDTGYEHCIPDFSNLDMDLDEICSVFVHELAHAEQWRVAKFKTTRVYRSYLERNREKFFNKIKEHGKEYLGSPQEIDSLAQDTAYDLLKGFKHDSTEDQIWLIADAKKWLSSQVSRYSSFSNTTDELERKVLNRYLKRVYQELDTRHDEAIAKRKQEIKSAAEKAAYDKWVNDEMTALGIHDE